MQARNLGIIFDHSLTNQIQLISPGLIFSPKSTTLHLYFHNLVQSTFHSHLEYKIPPSFLSQTIFECD